MKKRFLSVLLTILMVLSIITILSLTAFATSTPYAITNGTAQDANGTISIDKSSAAEDETVTVTVNPADGYQLKSLIATPVVQISTIADVLATVEGFPKDIIENSSPTAPSDAWTNETGSAFTYKNLALVLKSSSYMYAQLTTGVTFDATNKCYTATVSTLGTLKFNMTDGVLTSFTYTHKEGKPEQYDGTYTPASTPSARLKPITPAKQTDGTYTFTMPGYPVTVTAEFEEKAITIADILPDDFPTCVDVLPPNLWVNGNEVNMMVLPYYLVIFTLDGDGNPDYVTLADNIRTATLTKNGNNYTYTNNGVTTTFLMSDNGLESVKIEGLTGEYVDFNGTYGEQHAHSFTYTVNGGKLTATCTQGCDKGYDTTPLTLTLTAPASLVYDGNAKTFTFADGEADAWTGAGLELPTIFYNIKQSGQSTYLPLFGTLKSVGDYMAQITVGGKDAQVYFAIDKATPYIKTTPAPNDIEYGEKLSDSTLFGGYVQISSTDSSEVGGLFEWKLGDTIPALSDSESTEYDVTFTPADTNNYNTVSCKVKIKVTHTHNFTGNYIEYDTTNHKWAKKCACGDYDTANALTGVDAPTAVTGLIYDNSEQTGVAEATGYTVTDGKKAAAGEYTATATLASGYIWSDGTTAAKEIKWSIAKASVTAPADAGSKVYTGNTLTADVDDTDTLYTVMTNDGGTAVGNYDVVLVLNDPNNYQWSDSDEETKTLTFSITKADNSWTTVPSVSDVTYGTAISPVGVAKFGDVTITYVGTGDTVYNSATAPTNAGTYKATFSVSATDDYGALSQDVSFTISKLAVNEPTVTGTYTYNGNEQSATISGKESFMTESGDVKGTNAGTYTITYTLDGNHEWATGSDGTVTWSIGKANPVITVDKTPITKTFGEAITLPTATSDFGTVTCDKVAADLVNAGTYTVTYTVAGTDNYNGATETVSVTIGKLAVNEPTVTGTYTYTGSEQSATISGKESYMTENGDVKGTNAGTYTITYTLDGNHEWATGSDGTVTWTIAKAKNAIHDLTIGNWKDNENGTAPTATADFGEIEYLYSKADVMDFSIETLPIAAGKYIVKAFVLGTDNYDAVMEEKEFTIYATQKSGGDIGEGETKPVVQIETDNGFDPNVELEVEIVVKADAVVAEDHTAIVDYKELAEKKEVVASVYDVRLLLNGEEIQPDELGSGTVVTVRMLIPEDLIGKEFRLVHVHAADDVQTIAQGEEAGVGTYVIDENGYLVTKIDRFSEFVFLRQDTSASLWWLWLLIALIVIGGAGTTYYFVRKKKKNQ